MKDNIEYFFAASNSYTGFVNYFDKIFLPSEFERIYILKGGPGTGKSRFMKDVIERFKDREISAEAALCSSDPNSLDGLILKKDYKKIAIIDGTAPHASDPVYPGAVEKIINLGDSWNDILLKNNRGKILQLANLKKIYYKSAYEYLSVAKVCDDLVYQSIKELFSHNYSEAFFPISEKIKPGKNDVKIRLRTAFGKNGFYELDTPKNREEIHIVGIYGSEYVFMDKILNSAKNLFSDYTISPSPLDKTKTDSIYFESTNLFITTGNKNASANATIIDTSKFIDVKKFEIIRNKLETLYKERESMLWSATDEFKKAYDTHMETEKLYTASMNFKKNKKLLDKTCDEIKELLFPEDFNG